MSEVGTTARQDVQNGTYGPERWLVLLGALIVINVLGVVYGFSALVEPMKRTFPTWTNTDIQRANALALLFFALSMAPAGRLQDRYGPRLTPLLASVCFLTAFLLASIVTDPSQKLLWWLSYGAIYGMGVGLGTVSPLAALNKWFPKNRGLITGIALTGFGTGPAIYIPTVSRYLDPAAGGHTIQQFFTLHAFVCAGLVFVGAMLFKNPPHLQVVTLHAAAGKRDLSPTEMARTQRFWTLWSMMALSCTAGLMTLAVVKVAVKESGVTAAQAAWAASILAIFNAIGRPFWGVVSDRIGRERTFAVIFTVQAFAMFCLPTGLQSGFGPICVLVALVGLNFGGAFGLFAPSTADSFGTKHLGTNYGLVFTGYGVSGILGPLVVAYYKDKFGIYAPAFHLAGLLAALAAAVAYSWAFSTHRAKQALSVAPVLDADNATEETWLDKAAD